MPDTVKQLQQTFLCIAALPTANMVANARGSNPGNSRDWDSSDEEAAASENLLEDKKKKKKKKTSKKEKQQKLINGIEVDPENGMSLDRCPEPENIKEIISKDEATTGSR